MISLLIGRHPDCDIVVDDPTVSRRHVQLSQVAPNLYLLTDEGSTCGTFVLEPQGWKRTSSARVRASDRVRLGAFEASVEEILGLGRPNAGRSGGIVERDPHTGEIVVRSR